MVGMEIVRQFHETAELGRTDVQRLLHQTDVAGRLPQPGNLRQGLHGRGTLVLQAGQCPLPQVVVEGPLLLRKIHLEGNLSLLGQFVEHIVLGTP